MSGDRVLKKETFLWKSHAENVHQKLGRDLFLILVTEKRHHMQEILLKIKHFE